jgi:hypothetical protein
MRRGLRYTARAFPLAALVGWALTGCVIERGPRPPGDPNAPVDPADPQGQHEGMSAGELEKRLGDLTRQRDGAIGTAMSDVDRCEELCSLATSICEVAKRLEVIANRNAGNESYQQLKREAQLECREAMESCTHCVSGFENQESTPEPDAPVTEPEE